MKQRLGKLALVGVACIMLVSIWVTQTGWRAAQRDTMYVEEAPPLEQATTELDDAPQEDIVVHVAGAVQHPGVYTLQKGKRVEDALHLAGVADGADVDALNRASLLTDGQKITVPFVEEAQQEGQARQEDGKVDLNQATLQQLCTLPGIGEVKAEAIIAYRTQHGGFRDIDEVKNVTGIGEATFQQIASKIKI